MKLRTVRGDGSDGTLGTQELNLSFSVKVLEESQPRVVKIVRKHDEIDGDLGVLDDVEVGLPDSVDENGTHFRSCRGSLCFFGFSFLGLSFPKMKK